MITLVPDWQIQSGGNRAFCLHIQFMKNPTEPQTYPNFKFLRFAHLFSVNPFPFLFVVRMNQNDLVDSKNEIETPKNSVFFWSFGAICPGSSICENKSKEKQLKRDNVRNKVRGNGEGIRIQNKHSVVFFFLLFLH